MPIPVVPDEFCCRIGADVLHRPIESNSVSLPVHVDPAPLSVDSDEVLRVAGTRITLDTIVASFNEGATPEQIAHSFPTVSLTDVYAVLAYYLRHRDELDAHLRQGASRADDIRQQMETRFDPQGIRDRLLARRDSGTGANGTAAGG